MERRVLTYILAAIIGLIVTACSGGKPDARLLQAEALMSDSLPLARAMLDSIDSSTLSESDRHLHALLTIKGRDKDFERHATDSIILRVVDYYEDHRSSGRYAEALYYAGRVYSDLGDYPTALRYFHDALDALPEHPIKANDLQLKGSILSQTGRRLNSLRLHSESIPYLEKCIEIDKSLKDTLAIIYDTELLGAVNMHLENYEEAKGLFKSAMQMAVPFPNLVSRQQMYLAAVSLSQDSTDEALKEIRGVPERFNEDEKPIAFAYAARIYLENGILDTAAYYARKLIELNNSSHSKTGYAILLSKNIIATVPRDTVSDYIENYTAAVERTLQLNGNTEAMMQHSFYNYSIIERDKQIAEKQANVAIKCAIVATILVLIGAIIILLLKNKSSKQYISLLRSEEIISELRASVETNRKLELEYVETDKGIKEDMGITSAPLPENMDIKHVRERLIANLFGILDKSPEHQPVPEGITDSDAYCELMACLAREQIIVDNNPLWNELESVLMSVYKNFKKRFLILVGSKPKILDYHIAILIKCGLTPSDMSILVPLSKGGLSSRRIRLGMKLFGKKLPTDTVDKLIQLL